LLQIQRGDRTREAWKKIAVGALACGATAVGALAIGALAIGRLRIGRVSVGSGTFARLEVDELIVRRLQIAEVALERAEDT
jgi:hypothetical protein